MLCAYPTVKYVQISDTRLGCLRYSLLLGIAMYVLVFEMWAMGGWLDPSPVVGVVRFSLQQPTVDNCDPSFQGCDNAFSPLSDLPYCEQYYDDHGEQQQQQSLSSLQKNNTSSYPGSVYPCEYYEAINAQLVSEKSLTVITRASTVQQKFVCPANTPNQTCPKTYQNVSPEQKFYTVQSEAFTIMIDHAVTASKICTRHQEALSSHQHRPNYACSAEAAAYQGRLYSKNNPLCQREHAKGNAYTDYRGNTPSSAAPCYISPNRTQATHQDFFSLDIHLQAAGISMDDCNQMAQPEGDIESGGHGSNTCQTYRDSGATLLLNIYWSDFVPYHGMVAPHYYYSPQLVARSSFKQYVSFYDNHYRETRTLMNAHGIRLAVLLGGEFNQFNVVTFLVTLTTALGLLAVATTIVDSLMLYVLPEKDRYNQAKYEQSTEAFDNGDNVVTSAVEGLSQLLVPRTFAAASGQGNNNMGISEEVNPLGVENQTEEASSAQNPQTSSHTANDSDLREPLLASQDVSSEQARSG